TATVPTGGLAEKPVGTLPAVAYPAGCSSLSSQCQIPLTLLAVPDTGSNFPATSGSASGASDRYRDIVRCRTASTAWSRSIPAFRAVRVESTHTEISSADRSSVDATDVTGPKWLNSSRDGSSEANRSSEASATERSKSGGG